MINAAIDSLPSVGRDLMLVAVGGLLVIAYFVWQNKRLG